MHDIKVRKIDDWIFAVHNQLAQRAGLSMEGYLRQVLKDVAIQSQHRFADEAETRLAAQLHRIGDFADSAEIIREERWERG